MNSGLRVNLHKILKRRQVFCLFYTPKVVLTYFIKSPNASQYLHKLFIHCSDSELRSSAPAASLLSCRHQRVLPKALFSVDGARANWKSLPVRIRYIPTFTTEFCQQLWDTSVFLAFRWFYFFSVCTVHYHLCQACRYIASASTGVYLWTRWSEKVFKRFSRKLVRLWTTAIEIIR